MTAPPERLLDTREAARLLGCSETFLHKARHFGRGGPPFVRLGARMIRYDRRDLDAWIGRADSTKETAMAGTAMAAAFERAGGPNAAEAAFRVALATFFAHGGTAARVRAILDEIGDDTDHSLGAATSGHVIDVPSSPAGADRMTNAPPAAARSLSAPASPHRHGGQAPSVGDTSPTRVPVPPRAPARARRGLAALAGMRMRAGPSGVYGTPLPDGRAIGDVTWGELPSLARSYGRASRIAALLYEHARAEPGTPVREAVSETTLADIIRVAELRNAE